MWFRKGAPLHWEPHLGSVVVFDSDTGETHFLSDLPSMVLARIDDEPTTLSGLIDRLDAPADLEREARQQIFTALVSLERAELVTSETVDPD